MWIGGHGEKTHTVNLDLKVRLKSETFFPWPFTFVSPFIGVYVGLFEKKILIKQILRIFEQILNLFEKLNYTGHKFFSEKKKGICFGNFFFLRKIQRIYAFFWEKFFFKKWNKFIWVLFMKNNIFLKKYIW